MVAGCGKAPPSTEPPAHPGPSAAGNAANASADSSAAAPAVAIDETQMTALLADLTQAVRKYGVDRQRVPKSLDELVAAGYLTRVPQAPAGKRFQINKNLQVQLVND
jgi:hypothetical protein